MEKQNKKVPQLRNIALDLIDTDERREQVVCLLDEFLPHLAAEVENSMHEQGAKVNYELVAENSHPKIRVVLSLKKFQHEYVILLDSKNAMFIIGKEMGGLHAANAMKAFAALKSMLLKFKSS